MKYLFFALSAFVVVLLSSCIEGEEDIEIRKDGSAHLKMRYQVPGMIFSAKDGRELVEILDKELGNKEHLTLVTNRVDLERGQRIILIEIETDPEIELDGLFEEETSGNDEDSKSNKMLHALIGDLEAKVDGLSVGVIRDVDLQPLLDEYVGKNSASMLGDSQFSYTVHLPKAVLDSNADEILDDGKTLKWHYKLSETKKRPIEMCLVAPIPLPWWVFAVGGALILVVFGGVFWVLKKRLKKSVA